MLAGVEARRPEGQEGHNLSGLREQSLRRPGKSSAWTIRLNLTWKATPARDRPGQGSPATRSK